MKGDQGEERGLGFIRERPPLLSSTVVNAGYEMVLPVVIDLVPPSFCSIFRHFKGLSVSSLDLGS